MGDGKKRVLVVDDEVLLSMELEYVLSAAGYAVVGPATDIETGLRLIEQGGIDAAVLNVNLGGSRSDSLADRLALLDVPFLFITGHTFESLAPQHRDRPLVSKPFGESQLLSRLRNLLD